MRCETANAAIYDAGCLNGQTKGTVKVNKESRTERQRCAHLGRTGEDDWRHDAIQVFRELRSHLYYFVSLGEMCMPISSEERL